QYGFAHFVHRSDRFLESLGGEYRTKLTAGIDNHSHPARYRFTRDPGDERCRPGWRLPYADHTRFARNARRTDVDVVAASSQVDACLLTDGDVTRTGSVASKRGVSASRVVRAGGV